MNAKIEVFMSMEEYLQEIKELLLAMGLENEFVEEFMQEEINYVDDEYADRVFAQLSQSKRFLPRRRGLCSEWSRTRQRGSC